MTTPNDSAPELGTRKASAKEKDGILTFLWGVMQRFSDDDCPMMAASLSYYTVFSLPPLLLIVVQGAGLIFGSVLVEQRLLEQATDLIGPTAAKQVEVMLQAADVRVAGDGMAVIISIIALLFAATGAFAQLQSALNRTWRVRPGRSGIANFFGKRVASMGMVLTIAFLLLVSLAFSALLRAAGDLLPLETPEALLNVIDFVANLTLFTVLFAVIFRWMPDAVIGWRDVGWGAVVTTLLFIAGKYSVAFYLGGSDIGETFGAAGSLAVIMLWVYVASMTLLLGAEFTHAWARRRGRSIRPEPGAVTLV